MATYFVSRSIGFEWILSGQKNAAHQNHYQDEVHSIRIGRDLVADNTEPAANTTITTTISTQTQRQKLGKGKLSLSLPCSSVQIKHKTYKTMNSVQQQCEHHHQKVLTESFHLNGHTFRFTIRDLSVFVVFVKFTFGSERVKLAGGRSEEIGPRTDKCNNCLSPPPPPHPHLPRPQQRRVTKSHTPHIRTASQCLAYISGTEILYPLGMPVKLLDT